MADKKKKRNKLLYWSIPVIVLIILFSIKFNTKIYVGLEDGEIERFDNIAISVSIDGNPVYVADSLPPSFMGMNYTVIEKPLRMGFHDVAVYSSTIEADKKATVFILFNYYIMVTYWKGRDSFTVRTGFNPFHFE